MGDAQERIALAIAAIHELKWEFDHEYGSYFVVDAQEILDILEED